MTRSRFRSVSSGLLAAPLALALAACSGGTESGETTAAAGEPIAEIAAPEGQAWSETVSQTEGGGYLMGNPEAPLKLVEYGSLTCSHCADFAEASAEGLRQMVDSGRVSFEMRNFVRDPIDLTAAQLTRCGAPESYFALTDQVFAYQPQMFEQVQSAGEGAFSSAVEQPPERRGVAIAQMAGLIDFFAARGVSADQARQCLSNAEAASQLAQQAQDQGEQFNITGTPTFFLNGSKLDINTWNEVKARLENAGAR